jgi:hypothetical protein
MDEMASQRLVWHLFLAAVPDEDLLAHLDEEPLAGANEVQGRAGVQGAPRDVVRGVGDPLLREKLPRLCAGGSPLSVE